MRTALEGVHLEDTGLIRVQGADAVKFLQGQLSNDVSKLSPGRSLLAGYHNPQGRAIGLLRLVHWDVADILALVPRELAGSVAARLAKYVLRAKVKVTDESATWQVVGLIAAGPTEDPTAGTVDAPNARLSDGSNADGANGMQPNTTHSDTHLPATVGAQSRTDRTVFVRVGDAPARWLAITPASDVGAANAGGAAAPAGHHPLLHYTPADITTWRRLEVAAGQPQVYAVTSEEFVAQMLNLDALGGIAFDKGCYTGQEVIARAHYRGRVKRRMQRFVSRGACQLSPGDAGQLPDGRAFKVVLSAPLADGRCDFLAVVSLAPESPALSESTSKTSSVTTQAIHPDAPPITDPAAVPVTGPIIDPTLAPIAAASVAPTVAAAAALSGRTAPAPAIPTGTVIVDAQQVDLPYRLPD